MRNKGIREHLPELSPSQVSRPLERLRTHGLNKRVGRTCKYHVTQVGRSVITSGLKIRQRVLLPQLAQMTSWIVPPYPGFLPSLAGYLARTEQNIMAQGLLVVRDCTRKTWPLRGSDRNAKLMSM